MQFGAHESIAGGFDKAIERGRQATCDTIQMFNKSNNQWRAAAIKPDVLERYFALIEETGITAVTSHTAYLINIASPNQALEKKSLDALAEEMERCNTLKVPNLVMHPGAHVGDGEEKGMKRVAKNINRLFGRLKNNEVTLLLECTAGQGTTLGRSFEEIAQMIDLVEDKDHIGVCLDTCHVFAAGYALSPKRAYNQTIRAFDEIIGLDKLRIIHMNDSKKEFGSHRDRHEHIGKGYIGLDGFRNIVNDRRLKRIPMILETPKGDDLKEDIENLKVLRGLVGKK